MPVPSWTPGGNGNNGVESIFKHSSPCIYRMERPSAVSFSIMCIHCGICLIECNTDIIIFAMSRVASIFVYVFFLQYNVILQNTNTFILNHIILQIKSFIILLLYTFGLGQYLCPSRIIVK